MHCKKTSISRVCYRQKRVWKLEGGMWDRTRAMRGDLRMCCMKASVGVLVAVILEVLEEQNGNYQSILATRSAEQKNLQIQTIVPKCVDVGATLCISA